MKTAIDYDLVAAAYSQHRRVHPETVTVDLAHCPTLAKLRIAMCDAGFVEVDEQNVEFARVLSAIELWTL